MQKKKIAIIGYGRFGSLLAKILKPYGKIFVINEVKINSKEITQIDYEQLISMDWIFLAVPTSALEEVLIKIKPFLRENSLVMDVCSVKVYPCKMMMKHLPKNVEILGTHPMFGPDSAKNGLQNLQMVLCPLRIKKQTLKDILQVFKNLKLKIIQTNPEMHDKQGAYNLSLVHFLGRGLGKMGLSQQEITTLGFQRLLAVNETVNNDTWQLFHDIQNFNPYAKKVRNDFLRALEFINKKVSK